MRGVVALTDNGWYDFLSQRSLPEVNFWKPSDRRRPRLDESTPFFFQQKKPNRAIVGFAYFARWSVLPIWLAWDAFGEGNGCESLPALIERVERLRHRPAGGRNLSRSEIGCLLLRDPTFFRPDQWVEAPADWPNEVVGSKSYDLEVGEGRRIWDECRARAHSQAQPINRASEVRYGTPHLVSPRVGQGIFRVGVLDAYGRACALTGEHSLPVLEAAHIRSYASEGPNKVTNGILMRADLHRLFDTGYITISGEHRLEVSNRLKEDYSNGRAYYPLNGDRVRLPERTDDAPEPSFLEWHREHVYRG